MDSADSEVRRVAALHGGLDLVVLNAGVDSRGPAVDTADAALRRVFEVSGVAAAAASSRHTFRSLRRLTP